MGTGVQKFVDDMTKSGFDPKVEAEVVTFKITPVDGAHAGSLVDTGVSTAELDPWPQAPPHWILFPANVVFPKPKTNSQPSPKIWVADAQPKSAWLGRRSTGRQLGQPRSGGPERGHLMNSRTTSVAMTAATQQNLLSLLVRDDGQEDLCLATYRPSTGATRSSALIRTVIPP